MAELFTGSIPKRGKLASLYPFILPDRPAGISNDLWEYVGKCVCVLLFFFYFRGP